MFENNKISTEKISNAFSQCRKIEVKFVDYDYLLSEKRNKNRINVKISSKYKENDRITTERDNKLVDGRAMLKYYTIKEQNITF